LPKYPRRRNDHADADFDQRDGDTQVIGDYCGDDGQPEPEGGDDIDMFHGGVLPSKKHPTHGAGTKKPLRSGLLTSQHTPTAASACAIGVISPAWAVKGGTPSHQQSMICHPARKKASRCRQTLSRQFLPVLGTMKAEGARQSCRFEDERPGYKSRDVVLWFPGIPDVAS